MVRTVFLALIEIRFTYCGLCYMGNVSSNVSYVYIQNNMFLTNMCCFNNFKENGK